jgi:uncharacterized membrane protein
LISQRKPASISAGCWALAVLFVVAGELHFALPAPYLRIMPPWLPHPALLVAISGAAEIAGGLSLLFARTRRVAAFGLTLLLLAVWPANWHMAAAHIQFGHPPVPQWALWARVALQVPLIWWALRYAGKGQPARAARAVTLS